MITIRDPRPDEALAHDALQRRSSDVWEDNRADLAAHPDAIEPPHQAIAEGRVRVAVEGDRRLGFYERVGFVTTGEAATRFGNAPRMTLEFEAS